VTAKGRYRTTVRPLRRRGRTVAATAVVAVLGLAASACSALTGGSSSTYSLQANFSRGDNLFAPTPVKELGVPIGTITAVSNEGDHVVAKMSIDRKFPLPSDVRADLTQDTLLSQGFVQMSPGYTGGPRLPAGTVIPVSKTSVPATTDELLASLNKFLGTINPPTAAGAVNSLATVLQGNGAQLNSLIHNASGTIGLLAQKGNELGQLLGAVGQLTGTLDKQNGLIGQFINNYNTVSGVLADNRNQLAGAINHLNDATVQATALLQPNLTPLQQDVANLTSLSRGLDHNLNSLDQSLYSIPHLFQEQGYDPVHNWEPINIGSGSGLTFPEFPAVMADRLASVCRRFVPGTWNGATNTPAGCGDPNFFTPVLTQFASILNKQSPPVPTPANAGPSNSATAGQAFNAGLQQIPGLTPTQQSQIAAGVASPPPAPPGPPSLSAPGANQLPAMPTAIQPAQNKGHSDWSLAILAAVVIAGLATGLEVLRRIAKARAG
jgi:phospholipid/cholesterol/gamma-HCH transport system substrate-binding protein